jgi:hypothetical protein
MAGSMLDIHIFRFEISQKELNLMMILAGIAGSIQEEFLFRKRVLMQAQME